MNIPFVNRVVSIALISIGLNTSLLNAWEKFDVDVLQENAPNMKNKADHLLPSEHIYPRDYYLIQFVELQNYIESDWLIRITLNTNKTGAVLDLYENIPNLKYDERHYTNMDDYKSKSAAIDLELAESIYAVWANVLFETRYSKSDVGNFEGKVAQFSTYIRGTGWLVGEAQTGYHTETPPKHLIKIAHLLKNFINTNSRQRAYLTDSITTHIAWIYEYLKEHSVN